MGAFKLNQSFKHLNKPISKSIQQFKQLNNLTNQQLYNLTTLQPSNFTTLQLYNSTTQLLIIIDISYTLVDYS
jgi:hypothetical protein